MNDDTSRLRRIVLLLVIGLSAVGALWVWRTMAGGKPPQASQTSIQHFNNEVDTLFELFHKYKEYIGDYPKGNNVQIAKALSGNNPKKVILVLKKSDLNVKGEIVDPWNTPLKIYFADNEVFIRSAGPNKRFDDSRSGTCDDYFRSD